MSQFAEDVTPESRKLRQTLLKETQPIPGHTIFSDNVVFEKTCERIRGENETKVVRDIAPLVVPSAKILADKRVRHLEILRQTVKACWLNTITFIKPRGSRHVPRPQPYLVLDSREMPSVENSFRSCSLSLATYSPILPLLRRRIICIFRSSLPKSNVEQLHITLPIDKMLSVRASWLRTHCFQELTCRRTKIAGLVSLSDLSACKVC